MNFLIDANLPRRLAHRLHEAGHDAVHTVDFPQENLTQDRVISEAAVRENRIVITKDVGFVDSLVLSHQPEKLLLVSTGNIANAELEALFLRHLAEITAAFVDSNFVELSRTSLIIHW